MLILGNMMTDFLGYVRKRRNTLQKELAELEIAERVYRESGVQIVSRQGRLDQAFTPLSLRITMKKMVCEILDDMHPHGLTARELLNQIHARYNIETKRESLSPQLTRLKNDGLVYNDKGVWKRKKDDASPAITDEALETHGAVPERLKGPDLQSGKPDDPGFVGSNPTGTAS